MDSMLGIIWVVSIIATWIITDQKKVNKGLVVLSLLIGPVAVFLALAALSSNTKEVSSLLDAKKRLSDLKNSLGDLERKVNDLELSMGKLAGQEAAPVVSGAIENVSELQVVKSDVAQKNAATASAGNMSDAELNFGRNWLNKIGIIVFALGMGFLITYASQYFGYLGPLAKIILGYLTSLSILFIGFKLSAKEKFINFGRVLMGGGWALVYFTTYAMHHFEASRIIQSQALDLFLLALVVVGMIAHVLKYKSEEMMSVALVVAYVTATLGQITSFTVVSCLLLATLVLFLVYHFQWVKTFVLGIVLTYVIHCVWVIPNIVTSVRQPVFFGVAVSDYSLIMNFLFLTSYWLVFLIGTHIIRTLKEDKSVNTFAAVNFGNIALYSVLAYPLILKLFYVQRFPIVLSVGILYLILALAMKKIGRQKLHVSDIAASIFIITFSIPLRFLPTSTLLIWLIEAPFLLFIGFNFKEKIYRHLSYALTIFIGLRLIFLSFFEHMTNVHFLGLTWEWREFMCFWGSISMAGCFYLTQREKNNTDFDGQERVFDHIFSAGSCIYLTSLLISMIKQPWVVFVLSIEGIILLAVSVVLDLRRFRVYSYLVLGIAILAFISESIFVSSNILKWFIVSVDVAIFFIAYFALKYLYQLKRIETMFDKEEGLIFLAGIVLLTCAIFRYVHQQWISLSFGIVSVLVVLIGILDGNKTERMGGLLLLALTLGRVIFVDLSGLAIIFKIVTFIILGALFVGISFIYNRFNIEKK